MKNPFDSNSGKAEREHQRNLERWSRMNPDMGRVLKTQEPAVQRIMGERIEQEWQGRARNSGQLFKEEIPDPRTGRLIEKYHGDIKAAYEPFTLPSIPIQLSKVVWHNDTPFIESQLPAWARVERAMMENGMRPERGAPIG